MRTITKLALACTAVAVIAAGTVSTFASASTEWDDDSTCEDQFDAAQLQDMESFRDRNRKRFRAIHHPDAIAVYPSGLVHQGIDQIMDDAEETFAIPDFTWEWTELTREVVGCKTAAIVYDTFLTSQAANLDLHLRISVTYTRRHGKWLALIDHTTLLDP